MFDTVATRRLYRLLIGLTLTSALAFSTPALDWHSGKTFRWADLKISPDAKTGFTVVPSSVTGIAFTNLVEEQSGAANRVLYNGAGVAAG